MPDRDDETPTSPEIAAQLARIAERVRRRSTRTTEIAQLAAMELLVMLDLDRDDPRAEQVALVLRGYLERAVDAATQSISAELARVGSECERLEHRLELMRRSQER
jgi:hypothetical protein